MWVTYLAFFTVIRFCMIKKVLLIRIGFHIFSLFVNLSLKIYTEKRGKRLLIVTTFLVSIKSKLLWRSSKKILVLRQFFFFFSFSFFFQKKISAWECHFRKYLKPPTYSGFTIAREGLNMKLLRIRVNCTKRWNFLSDILT